MTPLAWSLDTYKMEAHTAIGHTKRCCHCLPGFCWCVVLQAVHQEIQQEVFEELQAAGLAGEFDSNARMTANLTMTS